MAAVTAVVAATASAVSSTYQAVESRKAAKASEKAAKKQEFEAGLAEKKRKQTLAEEMMAKATSPSSRASSGYGGTLGSGSTLG
jgi:hypothetical protein